MNADEVVGVDVEVDVGVNADVVLDVDLGVDVKVDVGVNADDFDEIDLGVDLKVDVGVDVKVDVGVNDRCAFVSHELEIRFGARDRLVSLLGRRRRNFSPHRIRL